MSNNKQNELKNFQTYLKKANNLISNSITSDSEIQTLEYRNLAIEELEKLLSFTDITDYLLLDSKPIFPKKNFIQTYFDLGTLYKTNSEYFFQNFGNSNFRQIHNINEKKIEMIFRKAINCYNTILRVDFEHKNAISQIVSIYTQLCSLYSLNPTIQNLEKCSFLLQEALIFSSDSEIIHYNLGFVFQKLNKLEQSLIHYKLSISLLNHHLNNNKKIEVKEKQRIKNLLINSYNGLSAIYRSIKSWPEALHYLLKAENVDHSNPDIQNALGVVYTEMRRTDLAEIAYLKAIKNVEKAVISNKENLLAEIYLNYGHMQSYNGDNNKSIDCYNKALEITPKFFIAFQNKIMNLSYIFDELIDKLYITKQHKLINKLLDKGNHKYNFPKSLFEKKINIGIISGDFAEHPVSYFIRPFLKNFDSSKFNVTCYSECIIDTSLYNESLNFKFIKNMTAKQASDLIYNDNIHILLDLAGHTAFNRLDIFALKPAPIQITYIGYPFTTGLKEMDYRITDMICDNPKVSQEFYSEKLLYLDNCFLCYDPLITKKNSNGQLYQTNISELTNEQPYLKNKFLTIGCFNRLNKITDNVIKIFNEILIKYENVKFMFKTKALLNKNIKQTFLNKFDKTVHYRIVIVDCTISHEDHLLEYNKVDIAIDTFPYSGTTTSCEALYMGVPVFTFYDKTTYFHPQNVTVSLLKNSHSELSFYIVDNQTELYTKLDNILNKPIEFWQTLKPTVRNYFLTGDVCNQKKYTNNISNLFSNLIKEKLDSF